MSRRLTMPARCVAAPAWPSKLADRARAGARRQQVPGPRRRQPDERLSRAEAEFVLRAGWTGLRRRERRAWQARKRGASSSGARISIMSRLRAHLPGHNIAARRPDSRWPTDCRRAAPRRPARPHMPTSGRLNASLMGAPKVRPPEWERLCVIPSWRTACEPIRGASIQVQVVGRPLWQCRYCRRRCQTASY